MENLLLDTKRYSAYKDSGVEWLGEIPEGWDKMKIKFICQVFNGDSLNDSAKKRYSSVNLDDIAYISSKDINVNDASVNYENGLRIPEGSIGYKVAPKGSVLLCIEGGSAGKKITFTNQNVCFVNKLACFESKDHVDNKFIFYSIKSKPFITQFNLAMSGLIGGVAISSLKNFEILFPSLKEQTGIVNFLDDKTSKIDKAIAQKEKLIELLKERKQILIQKAVTKGLDPDVKLKDSGVDWIGEIPEHWEVQPIKHSLKGLIDCEHKTAPFVDQKEFLVVRTTNVKKGKLELKGAKFTHEKGFFKWTKRGVPNPGDILLTREAPAGEACIVPLNMKLCLGQRMVWLKVNLNKLVAELAIYFIYSTLGRTYIDFLSAGSTVLHFNMADIGNIPIIQMPLEEQKQIVQYLNNQSSKIDKSITLQQVQIDKLKEYKSILIDNAVTGKIKVV